MTKLIYTPSLKKVIANELGMTVKTLSRKLKPYMKELSPYMQGRILPSASIEKIVQCLGVDGHLLSHTEVTIPDSTLPNVSCSQFFPPSDAPVDPRVLAVFQSIYQLCVTFRDAFKEQNQRIAQLSVDRHE